MFRARVIQSRSGYHTTPTDALVFRGCMFPLREVYRAKVVFIQDSAAMFTHELLGRPETLPDTRLIYLDSPADLEVLKWVTIPILVTPEYRYLISAPSVLPVSRQEFSRALTSYLNLDV